MPSISFFFLTFCLWLYFIHSAINLISILILCVVRLFILFISFHFCFFFLFCFAILYDFYCSFLCAHKRQVWVAQFIAHIRAERFVVFSFLCFITIERIMPHNPSEYIPSFRNSYCCIHRRCPLCDHDLWYLQKCHMTSSLSRNMCSVIQFMH